MGLKNTSHIRILHLEDDAVDAELQDELLCKEGFDVESIRVETRADFVAAIQRSGFSVILADYSLPGFDGFSALQIAREQAPDIPFIFVSAKLGEELAIEMLKSGATDYVVKQRLARLAPVISRALREAEERKGYEREAAERKRAEQEESRLLEVLERILNEIYIFDASTLRFKYMNAGALRNLGYTEDEIRELTPLDLKPRFTETSFRSFVQPLLTHETERLVFQTEHRRRDGSLYPVEVFLQMIQTGEENVFLAVINDITERKRVEDAVATSREQLRALTGHLQQVREEERKNIAREIHDELGQQLTVLMMDLVWLQKRLQSSYEQAEKIASMINYMTSAVKTVRRIATQLRPGILDDLGLVAALDWQAKEFQRRTGIECTFLSNIDHLPLDGVGTAAIFRIFQESLTNVARHSGASRVEATLHRAGRELTLEVSDNGRGMNPDVTAQRSLGLLGMRERASFLGGELEFLETAGGGATIQLTIPIDSEPDTNDDA
ncbi:MAG: PAS domain S-box protein [Ignavibacteriae bacterium]|nr:PAS domain S-box protein [Ignavibacteriota bacterium]